MTFSRRDSGPDLEGLAEFSNHEILDRLRRVVERERLATAHAVAHLAEVDGRRLHLAEGYSSLFTFGTRGLHLSEHATYERVEAARVARSFPCVLARLADGTVTLVAVKLLAPHLRRENYAALLEAAAYRSRREIEELVASLRPAPAVATWVRRLPAPRVAVTSPPPSFGTLDQESTSGLIETADLDGTDSPMSSVESPPSATGDEVLGAVPALHGLRSARPPVLTPLAVDRYRVQFTAGAELHSKIRRAQELLRHQVPSGDLAQIMDRAITLLLERVEARRFALVVRPRTSSGGSPSSRYVASDVRRRVWYRDGGRCAFVSRGGLRCEERTCLEYHHRRPFAAGGETTLENLELRCRAHNAHAAELWLGRGVEESPRVAHSSLAHENLPEILDLPPSEE